MRAWALAPRRRPRPVFGRRRRSACRGRRSSSSTCSATSSEPGAPAATIGGLALVPRINRLTRAARRAGVPVIFTHERHRADLSDFGIELEYERVHCLEGSPGVELAAGLVVEPRDYHITSKRRYDAFQGTGPAPASAVARDRRARRDGGMHRRLRSTATVERARCLDYRVFLVQDGVAATSRARHRAALRCLGHVFARLTTARAVVAAFRSSTKATVLEGKPVAMDDGPGGWR